MGLPMAISFAYAGLKTAILDINAQAIQSVNEGKMPFYEKDTGALLKTVIKNKKLKAYSNNEIVAQSKYIIIIVGTPIDEHLNPRIGDIQKIVAELLPYFRDGQTVILRSTIYPGTTRRVAQMIKKLARVNIAFCPERIAQGQSIQELTSLPQIISGLNHASSISAKALFSKIVKETIELSLEEAELAKLITNAWRYIQFATANQFFMIADQRNVNFHKILHAIKWHYPRASHYPGPGFTAGPCLLKDTMQIAAFNNNQFSLGHAAMLVNEGLPNYIVNKLRERYNLKKLRVGILGMAFKAEIDDKRDSLSYKLKKLFEIEAKEVWCSDSYIQDRDFRTVHEVCSKCEVIILGVPHSAYRSLKFRANQKVVDIWNFWGKAGVI